MLDAACEKVDSFLEKGGIPKDITLISISAVALVLSLAAPDLLPFDAGWIAVVLCGIPIILGAATALLTEFDVKADLLVSLALLASLAIGEIFAAGEVAVIMQLGALLEELTVARARKGIQRLIELAPATARVIRNGEELIIGADEVRVGDIVRIVPGESVPVDGVIVSGTTSIDQSAMTGESLPMDKGPGDDVMSGTINMYGSFDMEATRVGEDSAIRKMAALVESADAGKAKIVRLADRWATWIVVGALTAAALTWLITGQVLRAVTVLVVFCPCSLVLATPTAIVAGIGNATKHGFLVREGDALERLAGVKAMVFDKTGTLTEGKLQVSQVWAASEARSAEELLHLTAAVEKRSEHPVAAAIVEAAPSELPEVAEFAMEPGRGVSGQIVGVAVLAGNELMLQERGITPSAEGSRAATACAGEGNTLVHVAINGEYAGFIALSDTLRQDSAATISALNEIGLQTVLLTGDRPEAAAHISEELGITQVKAGCFPEDKLNHVAALEASGINACMVGDGVNDAPALKRASVSIAMGKAGSDIAVDAADIALMGEGVGKIPHLVALAKHTMTVIKCNITFSMTLNFVAIILAIVAVLDPVSGALVHNCGSVIVIVNSAFLLRWKSKHL